MNHETIDTERRQELEAKEAVLDAVIEAVVHLGNLINALQAADVVRYRPDPGEDPR